MIYLKRYNTPNGTMLAMCDKELVGKELKEGKVELDLKKYASFYKGELISEKDAETIVTKDEIYSANIVGERSVAIVLKNGIAKEDEVKKIKGVPVIQVYRIVY